MELRFLALWRQDLRVDTLTNFRMSGGVLQYALGGICFGQR